MMRGMRAGKPCGTMLAVVAGLAVAFWAGRASRPGNAADLTESGRLGQRAAERHPLRSPGPGGGGAAAGNVQQFHEIFKKSGGYWQTGSGAAETALAKMNGTQISQLVHNLAAAQAATPGYSYGREISAACARWAEVDPDAALQFAMSNKQSSFRANAVGSIIGAIARNDPALARAKLAAIDDPSLRRSTQASIMQVLSVSSPDEWVAAVKADPSLARMYGGMFGGSGSFATEWALDDPAAAAKRVMQLPADMQKNGLAAIAKVWAGKDSAAATAWAQTLADPQQRNQALAAIAGGIAAQDPDAALASLASLTPAARRSGFASVFATMADLDFDAALAKASALTDPADRRAALSLLAGGGNGAGEYISRNPEQLMAVLATLPSGSLRNNALNQLGSQLAQCSREEAAGILAGCPPKDREKIQLHMLQQLSYMDPTRALEIYQSLPPGKSDPYGSSYSIYSNLARQDPEAVLKLVVDKPPQDQAQAVGQAFAQLAHNDPAGAIRRLDEYPAGAVRDSAMAQLSSAWAQDDPAAAKAWVATLTAPEQARAINSLIQGMAGTDPKGAADMLGRLQATAPKDSEGNLESAASQLVYTWVRDDPEAAGTWTVALPDGNMKDNAIANLVSSWAHEDFDAAGKWLDTLPDGPARDRGVSHMVDTSLNRDPATAFAWAATIGDPSDRVNSLANVVRQWQGSDPAKARAAVNQADLTSDERSRLLKQIK